MAQRTQVCFVESVIGGLLYFKRNSLPLFSSLVSRLDDFVMCRIFARRTKACESFTHFLVVAQMIF